MGADQDSEMPALTLLSPWVRCFVPLFAAAALFSSCDAGRSSDLDYYRGTNAQALGRYDWARHYYAKDLEETPDRLASMRGVGLGWISGQSGSLSRGVSALETYLRVQPDDVEARLHLARSLYRLRRLEDALVVLEDAPEDTSSSWERDLLLSRIALESDVTSALEPLEAALAAQPEEYSVQAQAARVYQALGDLVQALRHARQAAALDPLREEIHLIASNLARRLGHEEEAEQSLQFHAAATQLSLRNKAATPAQQWSAVARLLIDFAPPSPILMVRAIEIAMENGQQVEASIWLEAILEAPNSSAQDIARLAKAADRHNLPELSERLYLEVLKREPTHLGAQTRLIWLSLNGGDLASARDRLEVSLRENPQHGPLYFAAGRFYLVTGDEAQAEVALERAVELVPWVSSYRVALADSLLARGNLEAAIETLATAPERDAALEDYLNRLTQ